MSGWLPSFQAVGNDRNAGGTYDPDGYGYPWRIVLHTMEGYLNEGTAAYHKYPPHLWYAPDDGQAYQTVPLDRSAFALYQGNGEYTNRARAIQVEIEGFAAQAEGWSDDYLYKIARNVIVPIVSWLRSEAGGNVDLGFVPAIGTIGGSASEYAEQRMSSSAWRTFSGVCSHRHVPQNDHWDTGGLNIALICAMAAELLGEEFGLSGWTITYEKPRQPPEIEDEDEDEDMIEKEAVERAPGSGIWELKFMPIDGAEHLGKKYISQVIVVPVDPSKAPFGAQVFMGGISVQNVSVGPAGAWLPVTQIGRVSVIAQGDVWVVGREALVKAG